MNPLIEKILSAAPVSRIWIQAVGLAEDFWKDGDENPLDELRQKMGLSVPQKNKPHAETFTHDLARASGSDRDVRKGNPINKNLWHAAPGEISEKMWGAGFVTPGGEYVTDLMIKPVGLTKEMSVLDLSAGLGGRIRKIVDDYGSFVTGFEPDAEIARRGMELSIRLGKSKHAPIEPYNPEELAVTRLYDCVVARETIYRVQDKERFMKIVGSALKVRGHLTFTDYIVNPEDREKQAILNWMKFEVLAKPLGLLEMGEHWGKVGIKLRVNENITDFYKKEVIKGLGKLAIFLNSGIQPDVETKASLRKRLMTWTHRLSAIEQGMQFYRFYGTKL